MLFTYLFKVTHDWGKENGKCFNFPLHTTYYRQILFASNKYNDSGKDRENC